MIIAEEELKLINKFKEEFKTQFNKEISVKIFNIIELSKDIENEVISYIDNYKNIFKKYLIREGSSNFKHKGCSTTNTIYISILRYMIYNTYNIYYKDVYLAKLLNCHRTTIYHSIKLINSLIDTRDELLILQLKKINDKNVNVDLILNKL